MPEKSSDYRIARYINHGIRLIVKTALFNCRVRPKKFSLNQPPPNICKYDNKAKENNVMERK